MTLVLLGYHVGEIAHLLNKSENNIKVQTHKGRVNLHHQRIRNVDGISQMLVIAVADSLMRRRLYERKPFKSTEQFTSTVKRIIANRTKVSEFEIDRAISNLPDGFLERLLEMGGSDWSH